jgi:hypothetical protein
MPEPPQVAKHPLKEWYPVRITGDGRTVLTGHSYLCGWTPPSLERAFRVRPLPNPLGFAVHAASHLILCAGDLGRFVLLDGITGDTLRECAGEPPIGGSPFALSVCAGFVICCKGNELCVREIATGALAWRHAFGDGWVSRMLPIRDGERWVLQVYRKVPGEDAPRPHLEVWAWPFGARPLRVLEPRLISTRNLAVSRAGLIAVEGHPRWRETELHVYAEHSDEPVMRCEFGVLDQLNGWIGEDHIVCAAESEIQIVDASTGTRTCTVALPGYNRYYVQFSPDGRDLALGYPQGVVYARDVFAEGWRDVRIDNPWPPVEKRAAPKRSARKIVVEPFFESRPPASLRSLTASSREELLAALHEHHRPAWLPVLAAEAGAVTASKFGGVPYLPEQGSWPRCGSCGEWLQLLLQLNAADLPDEARDLFVGMLQVFCCTERACTPMEPFSAATLVRLVSLSGAAAYASPPFEEAFVGRAITGWEQRVDYPSPEEVELLGIKVEQPWENEVFALGGDKLLGWPGWPQNVGYAKCPQCLGRMRTIVEIASEEAVPHMFGDGGSAWVSQCPTHRTVLAFHCAW